MKNESFELIALCEDILDDDEVTVEEVNSLGDWLDSHEEARRSWPGEVLAAPIQEVRLDNKVNKTELKRVAALLRRVQKEWVRRREEAVQLATVEKATAASKRLDLSVAVLPSIPVTVQVKSHSDRKLLYDVDLTGPSCSCPDWRGKRSHLPTGSLTRCCKHVLDALGQVQPVDGWPGWLGAFLEHGWRPHPDKRWFVVGSSPDFSLVSTGGNDWADVFSMVNDRYQRFGYNVSERRWSYGQSPTRATEIAKAIGRQSSARSAKSPGLVAAIMDKLFRGS